MMYREVRLDFTPEVEVCYILFERCFSLNRKESIKQHMYFFNFRCKIQLDHPVQCGRRAKPEFSVTERILREEEEIQFCPRALHDLRLRKSEFGEGRKWKSSRRLFSDGKGRKEEGSSQRAFN